MSSKALPGWAGLANPLSSKVDAAAASSFDAAWQEAEAVHLGPTVETLKTETERSENIFFWVNVIRNKPSIQVFKHPKGSREAIW